MQIGKDSILGSHSHTIAKDDLSDIQKYIERQFDIISRLSILSSLK